MIAAHPNMAWRPFHRSALAVGPQPYLEYSGNSSANSVCALSNTPKLPAAMRGPAAVEVDAGMATRAPVKAVVVGTNACCRYHRLRGRGGGGLNSARVAAIYSADVACEEFTV